MGSLPLGHSVSLGNGYRVPGAYIRGIFTDKTGHTVGLLVSTANCPHVIQRHGTSLHTANELGINGAHYLVSFAI